MTDKQIDELIDRALKDENRLPEGLCRRLEEQIDSWAVQEKRGKRFGLRKQWLYRISGMAASLLLCIGIFIYNSTAGSQPRLADTYTDPQEAAVVAEKALLLLSDNLNKGFNQVNKAEKGIRKVNDILNKHVND